MQRSLHEILRRIKSRLSHAGSMTRAMTVSGLSALRRTGAFFRPVPGRIADTLNRAAPARRALIGLGGTSLALVLGFAVSAAFQSDEIQREVQTERLIAAVSNEFPVAMNDRVEKWIRRFLTDQRSEFQRFLSRETIYADFIRGRLRDRGMPEDLLYLAMIESGFVPNARSRVEAMGVWQFMGVTARAYGLRVDAHVDERRDPIRATEAALDYLQELHDRFGSWHLAAAAYNAGPTRVARILRIHADDRTGDEDLYWEILDHLPPDTREYVPKIIAAKLVAASAASFGFDLEGAEPYRFDTVWVPGGTRLRTLAGSIDVPVDEVRELNPHLIAGTTPLGESYAVRVPVGFSSRVVAAMNTRNPWGGYRADDD